MAGGAAIGQALALRVGEAKLALPAAHVSEVLKVPPLTRVPNAPAALAGLANVRGTVVPVVSLPTVLGGTEARSPQSRLVLVEGEERVGLIADEVLRLLPGEALSDEGLRPLDLASLLDQAFAGIENRRSVSRALVAAQEEAGTAEDMVALLACEVGGQSFALPLESVISVMALPPEIAAVPRTDEAMLGMVPWRGGLLPLVSLGVLLDLQAAEAARPRVLIARLGAARVGLVVDTLTAILRVPRDGIDPVPSVLTRGSAEAEIAGVLRLEGGRRLVSILATDRLLRDGLAERLAKEEDDVEDAGSSGGDGGEGEQFLVFRLGDEQFGLPIDRVEEVVRAPERLTRLPKAPAFVEGVMNLRGRVLPVIDQRRRFASGTGGEAARSRIVVLRIGDSEAGFRVDAVTEVLRVRPDQLVETPSLAADEGGVIDRVAALDDRMVLLVDPQELLDRAERDLLAAMAAQGDGAAAAT